MKPHKWLIANFAALVCAMSLAAASPDLPKSTDKLSHVRVVRLSFVEGDVTLRRDANSEWSQALLNTPIREGFSIATGPDGYAEVEFENGSTARVGEVSKLDFTQLALSPDGDQIDGLTLDRGTATFHLIVKHHDDYTVHVAGVTLKPLGRAEFRVDFNQDQLRSEVFDGQIRATLGDKTAQVAKNKVLTHALDSGDSSSESFEVSAGLQKDAWDQWTQARDRQSILANNDEALSLDSPVSGWSDLDTFGSWSYFPGYGYGWAPYEPAGWMPYSSGMWSYYQGWGYTWVSNEPWGWLPYHNGGWTYDPAMGWFWSPGGVGEWSPALVNWYQGPGWVGWVPTGVGGRSACASSGASCITAVNPGVLQSGGQIQPGSPIVRHPASLAGASATGWPKVEPGRGALLFGAQTAAKPAAANNNGAASFVHSTGPSTVVMGGHVNANEFLGARHQQAIHQALGQTMGGVVPTVANRRGELQPNPAFHPATAGGAAIAAGVNARMPTMMTRGSIEAGSSGEFIARPGASAGAERGAFGGLSSGRAASSSAASNSAASAASAASAPAGGLGGHAGGGGGGHR